MAGPEDPVEVLLPDGRRWNAGPGVTVRPARAGQPFFRVGRWPCVGRVDTALEVIRRGEVDEAVVALDRMIRAGMVDLDAVRTGAARMDRFRGSAQARRVAALADGLAGSPQETRLRLLLGRAGLPALVAQFRVFDGEGFVARVDFAYPDLRIAIEYDGLGHSGREAFLRDRRRLNRMVAAGWTVLHVTLEDMRRPEMLAARVASLVAQRRTMATTTR